MQNIGKNVLKKGTSPPITAEMQNRDKHINFLPIKSIQKLSIGILIRFIIIENDLM